MKDLPLSLFWAFWRVEKSITCVESMRAWSSNPPPATKSSIFSATYSTVAAGDFHPPLVVQIQRLPGMKPQTE
jgi:hypothetical protein